MLENGSGADTESSWLEVEGEKIRAEQSGDEQRPWELLKGEELQVEYRHLDANLTAELCKLSLHLQNFVERRLVAEAVDGRTPRSEEGFRLGQRLMHVGSVLMVDSRERGMEVQGTAGGA
jgi:hypothetical protein